MKAILIILACAGVWVVLCFLAWLFRDEPRLSDEPEPRNDAFAPPADAPVITEPPKQGARLESWQRHFDTLPPGPLSDLSADAGKMVAPEPPVSLDEPKAVPSPAAAAYAPTTLSEEGSANLAKVIDTNDPTGRPTDAPKPTIKRNLKVAKHKGARRGGGKAKRK